MPTPIPRLWHPFGFFRDFRDSGVLILGLTALVFIAAAAFFIFTFRSRGDRFFSLPLFLSLVPFTLCSLISFLQFYLVLGSLPPHAEVESSREAIVSIQYPFQFGMVSSGALLVIYLCAYAFHRNNRNA